MRVSGRRTIPLLSQMGALGAHRRVGRRRLFLHARTVTGASPKGSPALFLSLGLGAPSQDFPPGALTLVLGWGVVPTSPQGLFGLLTDCVSAPDPKVRIRGLSREGRLRWLAVVLGTACSSFARTDLVASGRSTPCSPHFTENPTLNLIVNDEDMFLHISCEWRVQALGVSRLWCVPLGP